MYKDDNYDGVNAQIVVSQTVFDKRALSSRDVNSLCISLSNMHYLSLNFPGKLCQLLLSNGTLELLAKKTRFLAESAGLKAELGFSSALGCLAAAAACGSSRLRCRIVQARLMPALLPYLHSACLILDGVHGHHPPAQSHPDSEEGEHQNTLVKTQLFMGVSQLRTSPSPTTDTQTTLHPPPHTVRIRACSSASFMDESYLDDDDEEEEDLHPFRPVRVDDLINITKLVAYISKYEATRSFLRDGHSPLFYMIEHLTAPAVIPEIRHWAGSCMRNGTRTSEGVEGKRCGLITCGVVARGEAMVGCEHCAVPYCSDACRDYAGEFHENWCSGCT